ncbi:hypothetical protein [Escherichia coli]|uniref:hypothetical protein n=1 Tax=Escherichia coli TaxID=562 RepID=UPI001FCE3FDC|nr:hypothetical protein [Escherichia coli]
MPDEIYAELYQLREEVKGPDGFNTWRDAATAEKVLRLSIERDALRYRFLRDKDAFGDENEPGLASWGDLAEMEYNEFDANVDARMNNSDIPRHSITQAQMIENDVAASEKKAPNERYKQISYIDYLGAMSAFHSDKWHKMGSITGYMHGWNACLAAMLQGSQPVSQNYKLNEPSGNSPVTPDGWVIVPKKLTAENGAKGVLSGEFSETTFISCPECFGDDDCETCDGSGRIEIKVPVSWTTIKTIWAKGCEYFSIVAPQQDG